MTGGAPAAASLPSGAGPRPVSLEVRGIEGLPEIVPGDDLGRLIAEGAGVLLTGDVVVIAQKVVSKAEGRLLSLDAVAVTPAPGSSPRASTPIREWCRWSSTRASAWCGATGS